MKPSRDVHLRALIRIVTCVYQVQLCKSMVLRLHEGGLRDLAEYTRTWMFHTISELEIESYSHRVHHGLATGEVELTNISVRHFSPPVIHYRPSDNSFLYMTTVVAEWSMYSKFLKMLGIPLHGKVDGTVTGFTSDVAVEITKSNELVMHQCIARFRDFDIHLSGSLAAEILHWFHKMLSNAMQSRVEQAYCRMISEKLLPWLKLQLEKVPRCFELEFSSDIRLTQSLHSIATSNNHVDLRMKNKFFTNGQMIETISTLPMDLPDAEPLSPNGRVIELFLDEPTLQEIIATTHHSGQFVANMSSPFLQTECEYICLGKIVPELKTTLGVTSLSVEVRTNDPPVLRLMDGRAHIFLNFSFEIFEDDLVDKTPPPPLPAPAPPTEPPPPLPTYAKPGKPPSVRIGSINPPRATSIRPFIPPEPVSVTEVPALPGPDWSLSESISSEHFVQGNRPGPRRVMPMILPHPALPHPVLPHLALPQFAIRRSPWYHQRRVVGAKLTRGFSEGVLRDQPISSVHRTSAREPVLKLEITCEADIKMKMTDRRLEAELKLKNSRAILVESKIENMSQKTVDVIMSMSVPFLEQAVEIFVGEGVEVKDFLRIPSQNESMRVENGYIRLQADLNLQNLL